MVNIEKVCTRQKLLRYYKRISSRQELTWQVKSSMEYTAKRKSKYEKGRYEGEIVYVLP